MLIRFYTRWFKRLIGLCCWLFLFGGFCGGIVFGGSINSLYMDGNADYMSWLCAVLGLLGTFFCEVIVIAPLMILFTIDTRIKGIDSAINGTNSLK